MKQCIIKHNLLCVASRNCNFMPYFHWIHCIKWQLPIWQQEVKYLSFNYSYTAPLWRQTCYGNSDSTFYALL